MNPALDMREKLLGDAAERQGFVPGWPRPDGSGDFRVYAEDDGFKLQLQNGLSVVPDGDRWRLQDGWMEGLLIDGSALGSFFGYVGLRIALEIIVAYEQKALQVGSEEEPEYSHYKTGNFQAVSVRPFFLAPGEMMPGNKYEQPDGPASGMYRETTYKEIHSFLHENVPSLPIGPGWQRVTINLTNP